MIPMIFDTTGMLKLWVMLLDNKTIIDIWNTPYDGTEHWMEESNVDKTFNVAKFLVHVNQVLYLSHFNSNFVYR